jgi:hypothetical protein
MSDHEGDPFDRIERLLAEQQTKHYELGELVGEYRRLVADARDKPTADAVRLARGLPGARYRVNSEYIRQNWFKLEAELVRAFGKPE